MNYYDDLVSRSRVHFSISWLFIGIAYFLLESLFFNMVGNDLHPYARAVLTLVVISGLPVAITIFRDNFPEPIRDVGEVVDLKIGDYQSWLEQKTQSIFSFRSRRVLIYILVTDLVLIATVLSLNLTHAAIVTILIIVFLQPIAAIGGHALYVAVQLIGFLTEISDSELIIPIFRPSDLSLSKILRYYSRLSIVALLLYLAHYVSFFLAGYGAAIPIIVWMAFIGFFPFMLFAFSISKIHSLMRRIKIRNIDAINEEIQECYERVKLYDNHEDSEILVSLLSVQDSIDRTNTWPVSLSGLLTFTVTIIPPIAQIIAIMSGVFK